MKKALISLFAVAAMVGCSNNEVIDLNQEAIAFGDTFVENSTRADYSQAGNPVQSFKVYGTANDVLIFNGNTVSRPDGLDGYDNTKAWQCDVKQYWLPNATYKFAAIVDGGEADVTAMPTTISHTVADGADNKDLLYAEANVTVDEDGVKTGTTNDMVAFTFSHLLSKIYFDVTTSMEGYTVKPTAITVTGVQESGVYTISGGEWAKSGDTTTTLNFIDASGNLQSYQILPVNQTLGVTIQYDIYKGDSKISSDTKTGTITARDYAASTVYGISAEVGASVINFTVNSFSDFTAGAGIELN